MNEPQVQGKRTLFWALRKIFTGSTAEKRLIRYELAGRAANMICNCWIPEDGKLWLHDKPFMEVYRRFDTVNYRTAERKFAIRELVKFLADVPGDTAECGVFKGGTSYYICEARGKGPHHAFDSYEGLSEPAEEDRVLDAEQLSWHAGDMSATEQLVRANLSDFPWVQFHRGWIPDRFPDVADRQFCFVHVDVDLHQPTLDSLEFFWPRLSTGGMIVCDDYGFTNTPGATKACDDFGASVGAPVLHLPTGQGILIRR